MGTRDRSNDLLIKRGQTWVALGDSITEDPEGYVSIMEKALAIVPDVTVVNAGVSGNKARDMVGRFDRDVLSHNPDVVSISVGVNDVWHGFFDFDKNIPRRSFDSRFGEELSEYRRDLEWMAASLAEKGIVTVLISPTMIGEDPEIRENKFLVEYIETMKAVAKKHKAIYCPMNESIWHSLLKARTTSAGETYTTDGVHMRPIGAELMASTLFKSFEYGSEFPPLD